MPRKQSAGDLAIVELPAKAKTIEPPARSGFESPAATGRASDSARARPRGVAR